MDTGKAAEPKQVDPKRMDSMFPQAIYLRRLSTPEGKSVAKGVFVSFTVASFPEETDISYIARRVMKEALRGSGFGGDLDSQIRNFNKEGKLIATLRPSYEEPSSGQLGMFGALYDAAERVVKADHPLQTDEAVLRFYEFTQSRKRAIDNVLAEAKEILSEPRHLGKSAWNPIFGGAFVQEVIFTEDRKLLALDPNNKLAEINAGLANSGVDYGHKGLLDWIVSSIDAHMSSGAKSMLGFQVDATITVGSCGGSEKSQKFYEQSYVAMSANIHTEQENRSYPVGYDAVMENTQAQGSTEGSPTSAATFASGTARVCGSCGKQVAPGHVCSSGSRVRKGR